MDVAGKIAESKSEGTDYARPKQRGATHAGDKVRPRTATPELGMWVEQAENCDPVAHYIANFRRRARAEYLFYARRKDLNDAIEVAASAIRPDGCRHDHQRRIRAAALKAWARAITAHKRAVAKARDFHELWVCLSNVAAGIRGIGELTVYDTAHRIGGVGKLEPKRVYRHTGTRAGARALGVTTRGQGKYIVMKNLPDAFQRLTPAEAEDVLCMYKMELSVAFGQPAAGQSRGHNPSKPISGF